MDKERLKSVMVSMQGMTYQEWQKLREVIDICFKNEAARQSKEIPLASPETLLDSYERLF